MHQSSVVGRNPRTGTRAGHRAEVITFLENSFIPVERTLVDAGENEAVRETRLAFQRAMEARFTTTVEGITGRKVRAFLSQVSLEPDISVEVFVLEHAEAKPAPAGLA